MRRLRLLPAVLLLAGASQADVPADAVLAELPFLESGEAHGACGSGATRTHRRR